MPSISVSPFRRALLAQDIAALEKALVQDPSLLLQRVPWRLDSSVAVAPIASACASLGLADSLAWVIEKHQQTGIELKAVDQHGNTPAVLACRQGHAPALQVWLSFDPQSVDGQDEDGDDLLDIVVSRSHIDCLDVLVNAGADPTAWEDGASSSLLHLASEMSTPAMIVHLVQQCRLPVEGHNGREQTPLEHLVESTIVVDEEKAPRVQALFDAGARCRFPLSKDLQQSLQGQPLTRAVFDQQRAQRLGGRLSARLPEPSPPVSKPRF